MNTLRFNLIRLWVRLLRVISTTAADPADLYFCYRLLLHREPDESGWRDQMRFIKPGRSRAMLVESFINSNEYRESFGRSNFMEVDTGRFTMWVDADDLLVAPGIIATKSYETHVTAVLERELKPDSVFVDIGANMGWFTLLAAGIAARVIAIEPNYNNVQLIYRSILANRFDNVQVMSYAVTGEPTLLQLNFLRSNGFVSSIENANETTSVVEGMPLDALLRDVEQVDVIKMDIEGHEPVALGGMLATLTRFRPALILEFHPLAIRANAGTEPAAFLDALADLGYRPAVIHLDGQVTPPLDTAGVLAEWEKLNRKMGTGGAAHLDLIARPR
jgi:FkbM family methyltransferase